MAIAINLGFLRIGPHRELKKAVEDFWAGKIERSTMEEAVAGIRRANWQLQRESGIEHIPSNDFSLYDHVLDTTVMVGAIPSRYGQPEDTVSLDTYFAMARGRPGEKGVPGIPAMEMTKWFDTNYHYIVPEFKANQSFRLMSTKPVDEFKEAKAQGIHTCPVLLGPVSFLLLGKSEDGEVNSLALLDNLLPVYEEILTKLREEGADWVQLDEPFLGLNLDEEQKQAFKKAYNNLAELSGLKLLVAIYFSELRDNLDTALSLPVSALHLDLVRGPQQLFQVLSKLPKHMFLSLGLVNGRNIWRTDLAHALEMAEKAANTIGNERVLIGPSCSLLHVPFDLDLETEMDPKLKSWMAFARQKLREIYILTEALNKGRDAVAEELMENARAMESRRKSTRIHNREIKERLQRINESMTRRASPYQERRKIQQKILNLPQFPTTTIGSFPQTREVRKARADYRNNLITKEQYEDFLRKEIEKTIRFQEEIGLDVLVHGEFERSDMVEYFGEQLEGFVSTKNGWVQSYGTRCIKPPVIFGDASRPHPMTLKWITYAQSLTKKPVKGILTGPITILQWSFFRDDQPRSETCRQIALAIRDEVQDLEKEGIKAIQIDEPALREGLPLRWEDWEEYLKWAVESFRIASCVASDSTRIVTHMCYSKFNDIIKSIADMDADVIFIEASRSNTRILDAFRDFKYPNEIGPGVYDIHSPRVASTQEMASLLQRAMAVLSPSQLWVNPDCGLKTRDWPEVRESLKNMVEVAKQMRQRSSQE